MADLLTGEAANRVTVSQAFELLGSECADQSGSQEYDVFCRNIPERFRDLISLDGQVNCLECFATEIIIDGYCELIAAKEV